MNYVKTASRKYQVSLNSRRAATGIAAQLEGKGKACGPGGMGQPTRQSDNAC